MGQCTQGRGAPCFHLAGSLGCGLWKDELTMTVAGSTVQMECGCPAVTWLGGTRG